MLVDASWSNVYPNFAHTQGKIVRCWQYGMPYGKTRKQCATLFDNENTTKEVRCVMMGLKRGVPLMKKAMTPEHRRPVHPKQAHTQLVRTHPNPPTRDIGARRKVALVF